MQTKRRIRTLAIALIFLEYELADFKSTALQDDNDAELNRLNELVSKLAEASRQVMDAVSAVMVHYVNNQPDHHREH